MPKTVCFTGPRAKKLLGDPKGTDALTAYERTYGGLQTSLETAIASLAEHGCTNFWAGCASGFDSIAQRAVCHLKNTSPDLGLRLHLAIPWQGYEAGGNPWNLMQRAAMAEADSIVYVADTLPRGPRPSAGALLQMRNRYMLDRSNLVLALWPEDTQARTRSGRWQNVSWQTYAHTSWPTLSGSGTGNMLRDATKEKKPVIVYPCEIDQTIRLLAPEGDAAHLLTRREIPEAPPDIRWDMEPTP